MLVDGRDAENHQVVIGWNNRNGTETAEKQKNPKKMSWFKRKERKSQRASGRLPS